jgi:hypothetical protein
VYGQMSKGRRRIDEPTCLSALRTHAAGSRARPQVNHQSSPCESSRPHPTRRRPAAGTREWSSPQRTCASPPRSRTRSPSSAYTRSQARTYRRLRGSSPTPSCPTSPTSKARGNVKSESGTVQSSVRSSRGTCAKETSSGNPGNVTRRPRTHTLQPSTDRIHAPRDLRRPIVKVQEPCTHDVQLNGLCAICGKDLTACVPLRVRGISTRNRKPPNPFPERHVKTEPTILGFPIRRELQSVWSTMSEA